jgi:hypothetical protein
LLQSAITFDQSRGHFLRQAQMLQINNPVRVEMERQNAVVDIIDQHVLADAALVHLDHLRHAESQRRGRCDGRGHGCRRAV